MLGTLVNIAGVIVGSILGIIFKKHIKQDKLDAVLKAVGMVVFVFGIIGVIRAMVTVVEGRITIQYELLLLVTLVLGTLIGELLRIDFHLNRFGDWVEKKLNKSHISEAFVTSSLIFCVGAMAIIGSVNSALGDHQVLFLKAAIDAITALVLASTLGFGVILSGISILVYQGSITLLAIFLGDFMSVDFINAFSMVGYVLVAGIGLNFIRQEKLRLANMLPSLLLVIIYYLIF